eukprot:6196-Heterococcus_DN1.PRE.1
MASSYAVISVRVRSRKYSACAVAFELLQSMSGVTWHFCPRPTWGPSAKWSQQQECALALMALVVLRGGRASRRLDIQHSSVRVETKKIAHGCNGCRNKV